MKKNNPFSQFPQEKPTWQAIDDLIESILRDSEGSPFANSAEMEHSMEVSSEVPSVFWKNIQNGQTRRSENISRIERWYGEQQRINWAVRAMERIHAIEKVWQHSRDEMRTIFLPILEVLDELGQRMIPAPAHRSASVTQEQIYQPRRRTLVPGDLPVFSPLFCTAINPEARPFPINGLKPDGDHRLELLDCRNAGIHVDFSLTSSSEGKAELDIAGILLRLQEQHGISGDFVWFLSEADETDVPGAWTSGLVWLESKATRRLAEETEQMMRAESKQDEFFIDEIMTINLLATREYFMRAYEQTRQDLLFSPSSRREENMAPRKESLWLFIYHLIGKILSRMQKAEPVFHRIKPEWNAVSSLLVLQDQLKEWQ